jgi:endonuclease YncB( thermonuclease family)
MRLTTLSRAEPSIVRTGLRALAACWLALAAAGATAGEPPKAAAGWSVFTNCTLLARAANDGDSFHVQANGAEYIFRLYFADCPETDLQVPARVQEQASYWGVGRAEALEAGADAKRFARRALREPFTVQTRFEDARGQSDRPRYFAFIVTRAGLLHEQLVACGLARSYGMHQDLPDGTPWRKHVRRLDAMEHQARQKKLGLWASSEAPARRRPAAAGP